MAKLVLTIDLQQDNGTSILKGTQTKTSFTQADYDLVHDFLVGQAIANLLKMQCWRASNVITFNGEPITLTISNL